MVSAVDGTAATGHALGGALVTIKDGRGHITTATTDPVTGTYTADVTGFVAPFLVQVTTTTPTALTLYSVGTEAGTVNIHPYTDLIVRSYFEATNQSVATVFANPQSPLAVLPTPVEIQTIASVVRTIVAGWLQNVAGVDPATFDLISGTLETTVGTTGGTATGLDRLLEATTISGAAITIDGAEIGVAQTTTATIAVSGSTGTISGGGTTTSPSGTATVSATAQVQTTGTGSDRLQAAIDGVRASFDQFAALAIRVPTASASEYLPLFDASYLNSGRKAVNELADLVAPEAFIQFRIISIDRVVAFHDDAAHPENQTMDIVFTVLLQAPGNSAAVQQVTNKGSSSDGLTFRNQGNGTWKWYGDQKFANTEVRLSALRDYDLGDRNLVDIRTYILPGAITAVSATGPGGGSLVLQGDLDNFGQENWNLVSLPGSFPPTGTEYTFTLTPSPTANLVYPGMPTATPTIGTFTVGSTVDERVDIVQYSCPGVNGGALLSRAAFHAAVTDLSAQLAGRQLTVVFQHPSTFAVNELNCAVDDGGSGRSHVNVANDATQAVIPVPASVDAEMSVDIQFFGFNGELSEVRDTFD